MKASNYSTVEEFALDRRFRKFILDPNQKDQEKWEKFLKNHPEKILLVREAKELVIWLNDSKAISNELRLEEHDKKQLWKRIISEAKAKQVSKVPEYQIKDEARELPINNRFNLKVLGIAASLAILLTAGIWVYMKELSMEPPVESSSVEWVSNENAPGIKSSIRLSDGSKVILNAGSKIRYQNQFEESSREIFLEGEAFFEVAKDTIRPFIVHTGQFTTMALGTSFNIRSFEGKATEVTLVSGVIQVENQNHLESEILSPGEAVTLDKSISPKKKVDTKRVIAWTEKTITFDKAEFQDLVDELSNWYGVSIKTEGLKKRTPTITATYQDESLENILLGLSYKLDFNYKINGKQVEITFK